MAAAVMRNDAGIICGATVKKLARCSPLEGELAAARLGKEEAVRRRYQEIIVEGDADVAYP
ncbi:hypothetical protein CJ030_MR2G011683 [Morella rubra]|uniref:RNase H type-1 domain-containing protein n=1 Tax=Morella rubra TaxID=262757 RepID=A0A6A1WEN3_9ROSI|nr:hypothetical protein CJ030_MR2G011683 [Morella rubra]